MVMYNEIVRSAWRYEMGQQNQ